LRCTSSGDHGVNIVTVNRSAWTAQKGNPGIHGSEKGCREEKERQKIQRCSAGKVLTRNRKMTDEDLINERLRTVLELLDRIPLSSPEQGERILNEVTDIMRDPRLLRAAARLRRSNKH
jgi:hypothetical protein